MKNAFQGSAFTRQALAAESEEMGDYPAVLDGSPALGSPKFKVYVAGLVLLQALDISFPSVPFSMSPVGILWVLLYYTAHCS